MKRHNLILLSLLAMPLVLASCSTNKNKPNIPDTNTNGGGTSEGDSQDNQDNNNNQDNGDNNDNNNANQVSEEEMNQVFKACLASEEAYKDSYSIHSHQELDTFDESAGINTSGLSATYNKETNEHHVQGFINGRSLDSYAKLEQGKTHYLYKSDDVVTNELYPASYIDHLKYATLQLSFGSFGRIDFYQNTIKGFLESTLESKNPGGLNPSVFSTKITYSKNKDVYVATIEGQSNKLGDYFNKYKRVFNFDENGIISGTNINESWTSSPAEKIEARETVTYTLTRTYNKKYTVSDSFIKEASKKEQEIIEPSAFFLDEDYNSLKINGPVIDGKATVDEKYLTIPGLTFKYYLDPNFNKEISLDVFEPYENQVSIFVKFIYPEDKGLVLLNTTFTGKNHDNITDIKLVDLNTTYTFENDYEYNNVQYQLREVIINEETSISREIYINKHITHSASLVYEEKTNTDEGEGDSSKKEPIKEDTFIKEFKMINEYQKTHRTDPFNAVGVSNFTSGEESTNTNFYNYALTPEKKYIKHQFTPNDPSYYDLTIGHLENEGVVLLSELNDPSNDINNSQSVQTYNSNYFDYIKRDIVFDLFTDFKLDYEVDEFIYFIRPILNFLEVRMYGAHTPETNYITYKKGDVYTYELNYDTSSDSDGNNIINVGSLSISLNPNLKHITNITFNNVRTYDPGTIDEFKEHNDTKLDFKPYSEEISFPTAKLDEAYSKLESFPEATKAVVNFLIQGMDSELASVLADSNHHVALPEILSNLPRGVKCNFYLDETYSIPINLDTYIPHGDYDTIYVNFQSNKPLIIENVTYGSDYGIDPVIKIKTNDVYEIKKTITSKDEVTYNVISTYINGKLYEGDTYNIPNDTYILLVEYTLE